MLNVTDKLGNHEQCCPLSALPLESIKEVTETPVEAKMKVVEHVQRSWCLLGDGKEYYLDISCNLSIVNFSLLIKLTQKEMFEYQKSGARFLHILAKTVRHSPTTYYNRNQSVYLQRSVVVAIDEWYQRFSVQN